MGDLVHKTKTFTKPFVPQKDKDERNPPREWKGKTKLDDETRRELTRKNCASTVGIRGSQDTDAWARDRYTTLRWHQQ
jgi:hypothetical protein